MIKRMFRKRTLIQLNNLLILLVTSIIGFLLINKRQYKNIWIIAERFNEARDNGYHLFKYIQKNHPHINAVYVISKDAVDREKLLDGNKNNVINYRSFKHFLYYVLAEKLISTHIVGGLPDERICLLLEPIKPIKSKRVLLRHGIAKDYLPMSTYNSTKASLFICGAKPEFDYVKENFGYPDGAVKYTGFCRFDSLHNYNSKKQILLMPTYRFWLKTYNVNKSKADVNMFTESEYFTKYQSLINNRDLINFLEKNGYTLIFYPHYEIQGYINLFKTESPNIIIADQSSYDVQELLKESEILITDYSSVYFDFAYMKKPVIYYHFDYEEYRNKHYQKGYFDYKTHGFGPCILSEDKLVKEVENLVTNNSIMDDLYLERAGSFFPLNDTSNCKRNFDAILNI